MSLTTSNRSPERPEPEPLSQTEARRLLGEAWMMCNECGGKLWSFDGERDADRSCPYKRNGRCDPR